MSRNHSSSRGVDHVRICDRLKLAALRLGDKFLGIYRGSGIGGAKYAFNRNGVVAAKIVADLVPTARFRLIADVSINPQ